MAASEIVAAVASEAWDLREMDGVDRVSGTELGRKLEYDVKHPTNFNKKVVEKLVKEGKLNDSDIVAERQQCKKGFGYTPVTEYWLTLPAARSIALEHVWTPAAAELRGQVVEQLERLMAQRTPALAAPDDSQALALASIQAGQDRQQALLEKHSELLLSLAQAKAQPPSVYIDEERIHLLKRLGLEVAKARGDNFLEPVWQEVQAKFTLTKAKRGKHPRAFATVTIDSFDGVLGYLREERTKALSSSKKTVSPLVHRREPTGRSISPEEVSQRLKNVGLDVPAWMLTSPDDVNGFYKRVVKIETYEGCIDEASMHKLINWCSTHPLELAFMIELRRKLNAALPRKRRV